mgnify:CR=1 FL=1
MDQGWHRSAQAWIDVIGEDGDWGRKYVLDAPMLAQVDALSPRRALDLGCGEGRFCRLLAARGVATIGIDPTAALVEQARRRHPEGDYRVESAESVSLEDASVDLVVAYLSLIDIAGLDAALREVRRVLVPGGHLLIANLQAFNTAAVPLGWTHEPDGSRRFCIDHYLQVREVETAWRGIRVINWHRPLSVYMAGLLAEGFALEHFAEPAPQGIDDDKADRYRRAPNFLVMRWRKTA